MRVAAIQMNSNASVAHNLARAEVLLRRAAAGGATLAVLPENFSAMVEPGRPPVSPEEDGRGRVQEFLADKARELGLWIIGGTLPIGTGGGKAAAACCVYDSGGRRRARYDKVHLFDVDLPGGESYRESDRITAGDPGQSGIVDTPVGRVGLSVCYDLRFPEHFRAQVSQGAVLLSVPAAFTEITGRAHWEVLLRARAIENLAFVIAAGQCGEHPGGRRTYGHSLIVGPWGEILARVEETEGVAIAALDRARQEELRRKFPVLHHRRR